MIHNVVVERAIAKDEYNPMLVYSTNDVKKFESFGCDLLQAYDEVGQKYEHKISQGKNIETLFIVLK